MRCHQQQWQCQLPNPSLCLFFLSFSLGCESNARGGLLYLVKLKLYIPLSTYVFARRLSHIRFVSFTKLAPSHLLSFPLVPSRFRFPLHLLSGFLKFFFFIFFLLLSFYSITFSAFLHLSRRSFVCIIRKQTPT